MMLLFPDLKTMKMKINEIKDLLGSNPTTEQLAALEKDKRTGVRKLLAAYRKRL